MYGDGNLSLGILEEIRVIYWFIAMSRAINAERGIRVKI